MAVAQLKRDLYVSQYIAEAIAQEMKTDDRVLLMGEDVGRMGGVFGSSRGLLSAFGEKRVRDTPISEMSFVGMGVGLAMAGMRPIIEVMYVDFVGTCLEQIYNAMAKNRYMSGGRVTIPMVLKTAGGCTGSAAQHSQTLWGMLAHLPGMHVLAPCSPYDAKGLMAAAIRSDDPVVFIENKKLLTKRANAFRQGADVPEQSYLEEIGKAKVVQKGDDLTLASVSYGTWLSMEAADELAADGVSVEVVDLRSVSPLDADSVAQSVARTGRLLVVDEDYLSFGLSGELVSAVIERLGPSGLKRVGRHALPNVPIPAALGLEQAVLPTVSSIVSSIRSLLD